MKLSLQDYIIQIEEKLSKGQVFDSFSLSDQLMKKFPDNKRLVQLNGLSLAKMGATEKAKTILEQLYKQGHQDVETSGILGRVYKDLYKKTGNKKFAIFSRDLYFNSFKNAKDYYPGINAASLSLIIGEREKSREIALRVIEIAKLSKENYWCYVSIGEAYLLIGDKKNALSYFSQAMKNSHGDLGNLNSTYQQLVFFLKKFFEVPQNILDIFCPPKVMAFSSDLALAENFGWAGFPAISSLSIKKKLNDTLANFKEVIGYASMTNALDVLLIEAMLDADKEINIYLPFSKEYYLHKFVSTLDNDWKAKIIGILKKVPINYLPNEQTTDVNFFPLFIKNVVFGLTILRSNLLMASSCLLFMQGPNFNEQDGESFGSFLKSWPLPDQIRILQTDYVELKKEKALKIIPEKKNEISKPEALFKISRSHRTILYAKILCFEKIPENADPDLNYKLIEMISEKIKSCGKLPEIAELWGNSLVTLYSNIQDTIEPAFMLKDFFQDKNNFSDLFPDEMDISIYLHTGPGSIAKNPLTNVDGTFGPLINHIAQIDQRKLPSGIYASEHFAAALALEAGNIFSFEPVGKLKLAPYNNAIEFYQINKLRA